MDDVVLVPAELSKIMADHPELSDFGLGVYDARHKTAREVASELAVNRDLA